MTAGPGPVPAPGAHTITEVRALLAEVEQLGERFGQAAEHGDPVPDRDHDRREEVDRELAAYVPDLLALLDSRQ